MLTVSKVFNDGEQNSIVRIFTRVQSLPLFGPLISQYLISNSPFHLLYPSLNITYQNLVFCVGNTSFLISLFIHQMSPE